MPDVTQPEYFATLTTDGVPGEVYHGAADWIYEGELIWFIIYIILQRCFFVSTNISLNYLPLLMI